MRWIDYLKKTRNNNSEQPRTSITGPLIYVNQNEKLLSDMGFYCKSIGKKGLVICDKTIYEKYYNEMRASLEKSNVNNLHVLFSGECCFEEINRITEIAKKNNTDFVIGIGGGKALDTAKMTGFKINAPWVLFASSASTCAAWTNVAIVYSKDGVYKDTVDLNKSPVLTLIDLSIINDAPKELLIAGIGDSFAKYHEAKLVFESVFTEKDLFGETGMAIAERMYGIIKVKTEKLYELVSANVVLSGMVSVVGGQSCGALFAHAFSNAVSVIPASRKILHGYIAALGVVFQFEFIEEDFPDRSIYRELGLPLSFKDINMTISDNDIAVLAKYIAYDDSVEHFYENIDIEKISKALKKLL